MTTLLKSLTFCAKTGDGIAQVLPRASGGGGGEGGAGVGKRDKIKEDLGKCWNIHSSYFKCSINSPTQQLYMHKCGALSNPWDRWTSTANNSNILTSPLCGLIYMMQFKVWQSSTCDMLIYEIFSLRRKNEETYVVDFSSSWAIWKILTVIIKWEIHQTHIIVA